MVGIYPYQQRIADSLMQYKGRGMLQVTGRQTGKSHWSAQAIQRLTDDILANRTVEDLVLSQGTVYGARYHTVEPIGGSWIEMETWCLDTFGNTGSIWSDTKNLTPQPLQRWYANNRKFWFRDKKDRDWFLLKWRS